MDDVLFGLKKQGGLYVPSKGGIFGTAFAGNDGMDKLELLAENVVPVNHTGSTAKECPMTIEKLNRGITLLQENGIPRRRFQRLRRPGVLRHHSPHA